MTTIDRLTGELFATNDTVPSGYDKNSFGFLSVYRPPPLTSWIERGRLRS